MYGHACLRMYLLPTWMHFWACLQKMLTFLDILSQVSFVIYLTNTASCRKSQKFMAPVDWYLIHPHSLSNLAISSKLPNACTRVYKYVLLNASCCLIPFLKESKKWQHRQRRVKDGSTLTGRKTGRMSVAVGVTVTGERRRHIEGKTETQRRREEDADKQEMWLTWMWEGRERNSETEKTIDRRRLLDGREWCLVETEINPKQQRLTTGGRGEKQNDTSMKASKKTEQVQLFP